MASHRPSLLPPPLVPGLPLSALAPMQDVTDLPFMSVIHQCGAPDYFFTEFFRVHASSRPEPHILRSIVENPSGRPVFAQLIGESLPDLERTARELLAYPVAGIDLNLGCPAPKIYRKNVGGGLLRDPDHIDRIFGLLRDTVPGLFTVKMRVGFEQPDNFDRILELVNRRRVDLLSVHGRTVREMYRSAVHYDLIAHAVASVRCPVLANGDVTSAEKALTVLQETGAAGVMVGRSAIRNPWIFRQIRERLSGVQVSPIPLSEVRLYIDRLHTATRNPAAPERARVGKMKKYLNFVGQSVDPEGAFLRAMRSAQTEAELLAVCDEHLLAGGWFSAEPHPGVVARPNCETPEALTSCRL